MKFKIDFRDFFAFAFLFVGLGLMALGSVSKYFILSACILLAISCIMFAWKQYEEREENIRIALEDAEINNESEEILLQKDIKIYRRKSNKMLVGLFVGAILLIVVGVCAVI